MSSDDFNFYSAEFLFSDPLEREPGQPLDPTRHSYADLMIRARANPRLWAALWQQTPRVFGGNMIKSEWFTKLALGDLPQSRHVKWVRFYDLAFTERELRSSRVAFTAGVKLGLWRQPGFQPRFIIADVQRWQSIWHTSKLKIKEIANVDGTNVIIGLEGGGPQAAAFDDIMGNRDFNKFTLRKLTPIKDKVARAQPWIDKAEAGQFYIIDGIWRRDFFDECEMFPNASAHSDQIDAVSGAYEMIAPLFSRKTLRIIRQSSLYQRTYS